MRQGLILLTGGVAGPLGRLLGEGQRDRSRTAAGRAWPRRFQPHRRRASAARSAVEQAVEPGLITLADAAGLPLVATNELLFRAAGDA